MKPLGKRNCTNCEKEIFIFHKNRLLLEKIYCSQNCFNEYKKRENLNCICPICNKKFHSKKYHINKCKNVYCSRECFKQAKKEYMKGEGNHQFGLKGSKNASWKSDKKITTYGYIQTRNLNHPFKDKQDFVLEHRLIAEEYLLNDENSIEINGKRYLSPKYCVHHIDENKQNNNVNNLKVMKKEVHSSFHATNRNTKKVAKCDLNWNILEKYISIKEAGIKNNIFPQNISSACLNKQRTCGGFKWKFIEK